MKTASVAVLALLALVLVGCSDNPASVLQTSDQGPVAAPATSLSKGGIIHSATGGGHVFAYYDTWTYNGLLAFSAVQYSDGKFSGELEHHDWELGLKVHGKIIDLKVEEAGAAKQAKLSCVITKTELPENWPYWLPAYAFVVIQDNGKGEADFHTGIFFPPATGMGGLTIQEWIDMTPGEMNTLVGSWGSGVWVGQHGNFTIR